MWRFGACILAVFAFQGEALAQGRGWVPWGEIGAQPAPRYARPIPMPNRTRQTPPPPSAYATEDEDDDGSAFSNRRGGQLAAPRSSVQFPALLEGGARPDISPRAPQSVAFRGYAQGSIVIDTAGRSLYYVTGATSAYKYPISVGRDGFTWKGTEKISRVQAWPDWHPPKEMRERDPRLPEKMTGGVNNPLGAKALYLGNSLYRIHGTNDTQVDRLCRVVRLLPHDELSRRAPRRSRRRRHHRARPRTLARKRRRHPCRRRRTEAEPVAQTAPHLTLTDHKLSRLKASQKCGAFPLCASRKQ